MLEDSREFARKTGQSPSYPASGPNKLRNLIILSSNFVTFHLLIPLPIPPSLSHHLLKHSSVDIPTHDSLRERPYRLNPTERPQRHVQIRCNEQNRTQSTNARCTSNPVSSCSDTATTQNNRTPASQDDSGITRNRDPRARRTGIFELQARGTVLEDDSEGAVVSVGAASIQGSRGSGHGVIIAETEVHVVGTVRGCKICASNDTESREY
ncbi:unnamed protein product [Aspergillus oryzae RIB40]|uniref:DNA, SC011 n=1 Tax=Aspergillus oryzae (strain ATCC 42149 / RIB 40) TaxID=510516 RepID=Q2U0W3_ASPOR|nr:unnamed protein product [Aspergillus oryzae RIB40]BAE64802.1 unnamed protein product [Aspergillus oryzae RIB40]